MRRGSPATARRLSMLGLPVPPPPPPWFFSEVGGAALDVFGVAAEWDEERWIRERAVLAHLAAGRVVRLVSIGSAVDPAVARDVVAAKPSLAELQGSMGR